MYSVDNKEPQIDSLYQSFVPNKVLMPRCDFVELDDTRSSYLLREPLPEIKPPSMVDYNLEPQSTGDNIIANSISQTQQQQADLAGNEDPAIESLFSEAQTLYRTANSAYRARPDHFFPYIQIYSGHRSTADQAKHYERYIEYKDYGGPPETPANKPGKSKHEYGLAIDIVRGKDENNLRQSLLDAGWDSNIEDEGWHFESHAIASWQQIVERITQEVAPLSEKFALDLVEFFEFRDRARKSEPFYIAEQSRLNLERVRLNNIKAGIDYRNTDLLKRDQQLRAVEVQIRGEDQKIRALAQQINTMVYSLCPNGQPYDQCTHTDLKMEYDRSKQALVNEYNNRLNSNNANRLAAMGMRATWQQDFKVLQDDKNIYYKSYELYTQNLRINQELGEKIRRWRAGMQERQERKPQNIAAIETAVQAITNGALTKQQDIFNFIPQFNWISPIGKINSTTAPAIIWEGLEQYQEVKTILVGPHDEIIISDPWQPIQRDQTACTPQRKLLTRLITPPFQQLPPPPHGGITMHPPTQMGLCVGQHHLTLLFRGAEAPDYSTTVAFEIVENLYSNFSVDSNGWVPVRGNWEALAGQYSVSGDTRGSRWLSHNTAMNDFFIKREFEARISLNAFTDRCFGGLATYISDQGSSNGQSFYSWLEVVVYGDQKLTVRFISENHPERIYTLADRIDVSNLLAGKADFLLTVIVGSPGSNLGQVLVEIEGHNVFCSSLGNAQPTFGHVGLVFSSHESFESMMVDEVIVRPTRYLHDMTWCIYPLSGLN